MKKSGRKKVSEKKKTLLELFKSNNYLYQYCDFLSADNARNTFEIQKLITQQIKRNTKNDGIRFISC
jgi:hypothetical protein